MNHTLISRVIGHAGIIHHEACHLCIETPLRTPAETIGRRSKNVQPAIWRQQQSSSSSIHAWPYCTWHNIKPTCLLCTGSAHMFRCSTTVCGNHTAQTKSEETRHTASRGWQRQTALLTRWGQLHARAVKTPPPIASPASSTPVRPLSRPLPHLRNGRFSGIQRANVERRTPGCARKATSHEAVPCLAALPPCRCMPLPALVGEATTGRLLLIGSSSWPFAEGSKIK